MLCWPIRGISHRDSVRCARRSPNRKVRVRKEIDMRETMRVPDRNGPKRVVVFAAITVAALVFADGAVRRVRAQTSTSAPSNAPAQLIAMPAEVPSDAVRYAFLLAGNKAGLMAV